MAEPPFAALRDASFLPYPAQARRYHVAIMSDRVRITGNSTEEGWGAACRPTVLLNDEQAACALDQVPDVLRCRRPGCREQWPTEPRNGERNGVRAVNSDG